MKLVPFLLLLSACASQPEKKEDLSAPQKVKVSGIMIYKNNPAAQYKYHGKVTGIDCTYSKALESVKVKAVVLKANTIVNLICRKDLKSGAFSGCKSPMKCSGDAVTIK